MTTICYNFLCTKNLNNGETFNAFAVDKSGNIFYVTKMNLDKKMQYYICKPLDFEYKIQSNEVKKYLDELDGLFVNNHLFALHNQCITIKKEVLYKKNLSHLEGKVAKISFEFELIQKYDIFLGQKIKYFEAKEKKNIVCEKSFETYFQDCELSDFQISTDTILKKNDSYYGKGFESTTPSCECVSKKERGQDSLLFDSKEWQEIFATATKNKSKRKSVHGHQFQKFIFGNQPYLFKIS